MREIDRNNGRTDDTIRPRYCVWENVKGAFSSNKGEDFRAVIEELAKIGGGNITIPKPDKWLRNGVVLGDKFSVAWCIHNSSKWGIPQNRERVCVVADFGGQSAPEILFKRKSVSGNTQQSRTEKQETAGGNGNGIEEYH